MINYEHAAKGIKKVFVAEILELVSSILPVLATIGALSTVVFAEEGLATAGVVTVLGTMVCVIAALVLAVLAFVLEIIGLKQTSAENDSFRVAFCLVIIQLFTAVFVGVISIISLNSSTTTVWYNFLSTFADILNIIVTIYVINGCSELVVAKGREDLAIEGANLLSAIVILYAFGCFLGIMPIFTPNTLDMIVYGIYIVVQAIAFVLFLSFLARTKRVLLTK